MLLGLVSDEGQGMGWKGQGMEGQQMMVLLHVKYWGQINMLMNGEYMWIYRG